MKKLIILLVLLLGQMSVRADTNSTETINNYGIIATNLIDFSYLSVTNASFSGVYYDSRTTFTNVEFVAIDNRFMLNLNSNQMEIVKERFPGKVFTNSITIY